MLKRAYKKPLDFLLVCGKIASTCYPNKKLFDLVVSFCRALTYILLAAIHLAMKMTRESARLSQVNSVEILHQVGCKMDAPAGT